MNDVRRIAFVSERFLELQGLIPAVFGAGLLMGAVMHQALAGIVPGSATPITLFGMMAGSMPATLFLQRSYKRTFGDVVAPRRRKFLAGLPTTLVWAGAMTDMFRSIEGHSSGPSVAALALVAYSIAIVVRDWPWRSHYLVAAGAGLAGAYATASLTSEPDRWGVDPLGAPAYLLAYTLIGLALVVTGLFDHRLLAANLRTGRSDARPSPRSLAVIRTWMTAVVCAGAGLSLQFDLRWIRMSFPMTMLMAVFGAYVVVAGVRTVRAFRAFPDVSEPAAPELRVDVPASIAIGVVAAAAAVQGALLADRPPVLLVAAIAAACAWLALANWRDRRDYLLVCAGATVALPFILRADPARGFIIAVFTIALGFVHHGIAAWRRSLGSENSHADAL